MGQRHIETVVLVANTLGWMAKVNVSAAEKVVLVTETAASASEMAFGLPELIFWPSKVLFR